MRGSGRRRSGIARSKERVALSVHCQQALQFATRVGLWRGRVDEHPGVRRAGDLERIGVKTQGADQGMIHHFGVARGISYILL